MEPLVTAHQIMMWLSMCSADESRQQLAYMAHTLLVLIVNMINFVGSLAYCFKYVSTDFVGAIFASMGVIGEFQLIYVLIAAILMSYQIDSIFTSLSTIYESQENEVAFRYLTRANNTSEWMCKVYMKSIVVSLVGMVIIALLSILYCYLIRGNLNTVHFYRPSNAVLPWNQTSLTGYLIEMGLYIPVSYGALMLNGSPLLLFISLCIHHEAFFKMFKHKIDTSEKCDAKLACDLIHFHISAKDFFLDSANVYSPFVLVQLICSTGVMVVSIIYLDLQWHHFTYFVVTVFLALSCGISILLLYCYFGKLATQSYEMMSDCIYNDVEWYKQPIELQKYFILMIANMQRSVYYHGFEVAQLELRTFIKLCNSILSYYMLVKALAVK